jgi:thiol-disulfide isomerase/thioredoxin
MPSRPGTPLPHFDLSISNPWIDDAGGDHRSDEHYKEARILVVVFMCNHCPYVIHVQPELIRLAAEYEDRGVQFVGISSNDPVAYPADSFENMASEAQRLGYPFPYLFDKSQGVARAFGAVCTPDIFVYDRSRRLQYHGRLDGSRPGGAPPDGADLRAVLDSLVGGGDPPVEQVPSLGCSIKWRR